MPLQICHCSAVESSLSNKEFRTAEVTGELENWTFHVQYSAVRKSKYLPIIDPWDKNGNRFLSGDLNEISRVVVMKNPSKKIDKDPDYYLCIGAKSKTVKDKISLH